jgi:hypothetical protein
MQEKELVIEPVIRWASTANVTVIVKVHSIKVSAQVSLVPCCIIQISLRMQPTDMVTLTFSASRFTCNVDTTSHFEAPRAKLSLLC